MKNVRDLPIALRKEVATVLGCERVARGLDEDEAPSAHAIELGEPFDALGL